MSARTTSARTAARGGPASADETGPTHPASPAAAGAPAAPGGFGALFREVASGATVALIALPFAVSAGVIAYEPLGPDQVARGAAAGIVCAVAGGVAGALARSSSFVLNNASVTMGLIQAGFVTAALPLLGGRSDLALAILPLATLMAGIWQAVLGLSGIGRIVKFTPYPVVAGFLTGLGVLTFVQQLPKLFEVRSLADLAHALAAGELPRVAMPLLAALVVALTLASGRYAPKLPALLVGLVGGALAWHGLKALAPGLPLGATVGHLSIADAALGLALNKEALGIVLGSRDALQTLFLTSLTIAIVGTLDLTFAVQAAKNLHDVPASPPRDLAGQGVGNMAAALAGGVPVTAGIGLSTSLFDGGGRTRVATISTGCWLLVLAVIGPSFIAQIPTLVLAAILIVIAWKLWDRWCVTLIREGVRATKSAGRTRARRNLAIVGAVAASTVLGQPVVGAAVGVLLSCVVFIMEMSRPIVRRRLDGRQLSSKRIRCQADRAVLAREGGRIVVLELQGVLFFGNADDLASTIRPLEAGADILILDLRRVTDLDTSGASVVTQITQRCDRSRTRLMLAAVDPSYGDLLEDALAGSLDASVFPDLDTALEAAESLLLAADDARRGWDTLALHETDLAAGLSARELAALEARLERRSYEAGAALCRVGEPADRLWLILRGSVSVSLEGAHGARRLAGLGPGTAVGEMGLLDRRPRSADVLADEPVETLMLRAVEFERLLREEPHLGQSLLATVARLTAQRLRATSDELRLAEI